MDIASKCDAGTQNSTCWDETDVIQNAWLEICIYILMYVNQVNTHAAGVKLKFQQPVRAKTLFKIFNENDRKISLDNVYIIECS